MNIKRTTHEYPRILIGEIGVESTEVWICLGIFVCGVMHCQIVNNL